MELSPAEAFASLEQCASSFEPLALLVGLTQRYLFVPANEFHDESSELHRSARRIELVAGMLLSRTRTTLGSKLPTRDDFELVSKLAEAYLVSLSRQIVRESSVEPDLKHQDLAYDARNHSLNVRGEAYPHQFYEFARGLYGSHDAWFRTNLGFTIGEGISIAQAFFRQYEVRNLASRQRAAKEFARRIAVAPSDTTADFAEALGERVTEEFHYGHATENLGLAADEIAEASRVPIGACQHFLDRMSQQFGYRHPEHPDAFRNPLRAGWDFSTLSERPFLRHCDRYYMVLPSFVPAAIYTTFYFDIWHDPTYVNAFNPARGAWLESETTAFLRRVFPGDSVIPNPRYPDGNELTDVLVLHDRMILIVQCKSKGLRFQSKIGLDSAGIREDLQKAVKAAFEQGLRARDYLAGDSPRIRVGEDQELEIDGSQVSAMYIVTVTPLGLQTFATRIANQDAVLQISRAGEYPWAVSLADLDILTELLDSPALFLHYITRRVQLERTPFMFLGDEIDLLGLYFSQGMCFDDERFRGFGWVSISGFSPDVDQYIYEKHGLGQAPAKPRPPMPEGFAELLNDLQSSGCLGATSCALTLLDYSGRARAQLMDGINLTKERLRETGKMQRFSAITVDGTVGVSFLAGNSSGDFRAFLRQIESYAILQKHVERCPVWVAMAWDAASVRTVDLCLFLSGTWCDDPELDRIAESMGVKRRAGTGPGGS
jgi:hypothetical protein